MKLPIVLKLAAGGFLFLLTTASSCNDTALPTANALDGDLALGKQSIAEIAANPTEYPVLVEAQYPQAYAYLNRIKDNILNSGQVKYKTQFPWQLKIINKPIENAFCLPGGYIYVYTGLIKRLDAEYELAGVMGHEMAHADLRHSSRSMTEQYGVNLLTQLAFGQKSPLLSQLAGNLINLKFSRVHEQQADEQSVKYLCGTKYKSDGAAVFFQKIIASGTAGSTPVFLSTHPDPGNRVADIEKTAGGLTCSGKETGDNGYAAFKNSLPR